MWPPSAAICCAVNHGVVTVCHFIRYTWGEMLILNVLLTVQIREKAKSDKGLVWRSEKGTSTKTFPLLCMMFSHKLLWYGTVTQSTEDRWLRAHSAVLLSALFFQMFDNTGHIKLTSLLLPNCNISPRVSKSSTFGQERCLYAKPVIYCWPILHVGLKKMWFYIITFIYWDKVEFSKLIAHYLFILKSNMLS